MAYKNKIISNPVTNQTIKFLQTAKDTAGSLLEMQSTYVGKSKEPAVHYHPKQQELFTVLEGELSVVINGKKSILKKGDQLQIAANEVHSMWNDTDGTTVVNWKVWPALDTEYLLETATGLATDGKTNKDGMPDILQLSLTGVRFDHVFRIAKPPHTILIFLFYFLTPIARLLGYKSVYEKYID
ncbi:MAG: cupin domain-containing protein [Chitinophagaceae bacterium]|nr:cupin domain-containing protein [Chitinophagaceae bacterium]